MNLSPRPVMPHVVAGYPYCPQALKSQSPQDDGMAGRSVEAEHREILRTFLKRPKRRSIGEVLSAMPNVGKDADFDCRDCNGSRHDGACQP